MRRFNSLLALLTWRDLTTGAAHRPLSRALATLVERGGQRGLRWANSKRGCGIVPLSRRSGSDWEGEGNDRRSWGEVLRARGAECAVSPACWSCSRGVTSPRSLSHRPLSRALATLVERGVQRGLLVLLTVSEVAALCPSPEEAIATGRERGMTAGHGVRFCKRGVQRGLSLAKSKRRCCIVPLSRRSGSDWEGEGNDRRSWGEVPCATWVGAGHGRAERFDER